MHLPRALCLVAFALWVAVALPVCAATVLVAQPLQKKTPELQRRLNPKIGRANRQKYRSIQDAKNWRNPTLTVRANGIEVAAKGIPSGSKTVAAADLLRTLVDLPVDAWPYGRVVAAGDIGIRAADLSDEEPIRQNHQAVETVLKELGVEVDWWPSA